MSEIENMQGRGLPVSSGRREWQADWIWLPAPVDAPDVYAHARREFEVEGTPSDARLRISANNIYRLHVNGIRIGRGPDRADPRFPYYDEYEVTPHLHQGTNVIAVDLYCILTVEDRGRSWCLYGGDPGLLIELDYRAAGESRFLATDEDWRIIQSPAWRPNPPRITRFLGFVEHHDAVAAEAMRGYREPGFDDTSWPAPKLLGRPPGGPVGDPLARECRPLVPRRHGPVSIGSLQQDTTHSVNETAHLGILPNELHTVSTRAGGAPTVVTFEFERAMGGMIDIRLRKCSGGRMEIYYGENTVRVLHEIVELPFHGDLQFESFDWRGMRHVALFFYELPEPVVVESVQFIELEYPFDHTGDFEASDPRLGRIWRTCRTTVQAGVKDHPQDSVSREQALWYSDLPIHVQAAAACFSDLTPFAKACRQGVQNINPDGVLPVPGPCGQGYHYNDEELPWSEQPLNLAMIIASLYLATGDDALPRFAAPDLQRMMDRFARYEDDRGRLQLRAPGLPMLQVFTGWGTMLKHEGLPLNMNAEYVLSLRAMAQIWDTAGKPDEAASYRDRANRLAAVLTDDFYQRDTHLFIDGEKDGKPFERYAPTVNAWAVLAGLLPEGEEGAWGHAVENHPEIGELLSTFDASVLLEAYFVAGQDDRALRLLDACWGAFLDEGEPCVPERWVEGHHSALLYDWKNGGSRCHPYGTGPSYCLHRYILGVQPLSPGFQRIAVAPRHLGLTHARGRVPTPRGEITVAWRRDRYEWVLEVELPPGVEAEVTLPRFAWAPCQMLCDGETVWSVEAATRFLDATLRDPHRDQERTGCVTVSGEGRHAVIMKSGRVHG